MDVLWIYYGFNMYIIMKFPCNCGCSWEGSSKGKPFLFRSTEDTWQSLFHHHLCRIALPHSLLIFLQHTDRANQFGTWNWWASS